MSAWGGWGELYHYSVFALLEFYWNVHISFLIASNGSPIQNLGHTNSKLKQKKYPEFEMHEKMKKSGLSKINAKSKHLNIF